MITAFRANVVREFAAQWKLEKQIDEPKSKEIFKTYFDVRDILELSFSCFLDFREDFEPFSTPVGQAESANVV